MTQQEITFAQCIELAEELAQPLATDYQIVRAADRLHQDLCLPDDVTDLVQRPDPEDLPQEYR
jgi:hypothetical protein